MEVPVSTSRAPRTGVWRGMMVCAVVTVVLLGTATTALASTDHFFSGTLAQGFGFASTGAHSISYIEATGNHNGFCVAKDTGTTGYASATKSVAGTRTCASSGGFASRVENSACCYHGWVDNSTGVDIVISPSAFYTY
jgi:hypothetical protein